MSVLAGGLALVAVLGLAYLALAAASVLRLARRPLPRTEWLPSVTILKPLHGDEPGLADALASFCEQDYDGPVEIVFGVQSPADPAIAVVDRLRATMPGREFALVVDGHQHGSNRKVSNLINMSAVSRHEVLVLADSDMHVGPTYLRDVVAALAKPGVGAVTCLYHGRDDGGFWSRLARLGIDTHFLPSVAVGLQLGLAKPCFGSTIAIRRGTLDAIGGFAALRDELADDYRIGAAVRDLGLRVAVPPFTIGHSCPERSARALMRQELRWVRTIRTIDPAGHAGSILAHPLPFALAALAVAPGPLAIGLAASAIALRVALCLAVERAFGLRRHSYWLAPARDMLSFAVFLASFAGRGVSWRGHAYRVDQAGLMAPKQEVLDAR